MKAQQGLRQSQTFTGAPAAHLKCAKKNGPDGAVSFARSSDHDRSTSGASAPQRCRIETRNRWAMRWYRVVLSMPPTLPGLVAGVSAHL